MTEAQLIHKLSELRVLPAETEVVEFKEAGNDYDFRKLGKYFSALSNEANLKGKSEAWLIFGVKDVGKQIVGSQYREGNRAELDSLKNEIANKTTNRITFIEIYELNLSEGRVVMFQIPPAPPGIPIAWEGFWYGRDGETLAALNIEELERIRRQTAQNDWSAEICEAATIHDLDSNAIKAARENFKKKNSRLAAEVDIWDNSTFLNNARITISGNITRAAILLLGTHVSANHLLPAVAQITWKLMDKESVDKDYQHFSTPFILSVDKVFEKIRNLKYRYLKHGTLFPEEVDQYEPDNIKEALSNCIAHQDYSLHGRITVTEREDGYLTFTNLGSFLPGSLHNVILRDNPPEYYRNHYLAQAMANLNMIDTIGSGIKRMFRLQSKRFFPLPDYDLSDNTVKVTLIGKQLDVEYARVLAQNPDLTLEEIILLDNVQKKKELSDKEIKHLRGKKLIEGRKPHFFISAVVAQSIGQKAEYTKKKAFKKQEYLDWIIQGIKDHGSLSRKDINALLINRLSDLYDEKQKKIKINNLIAELRKTNKIRNAGSDSNPQWALIEKDK
jgi:ATP-dependent DNA helicase RecG